ncbi:hypothetical protein LXA43DRAFT_853982, partial [Ganoderma leucocontextum]
IVPPSPPQIILASSRVRIWHPGCRQLLLALPAFTRPATAAGIDTLHDDGADHRLALDACHIITNHAANERDCYLSKDRAGQDRVLQHSDALAPGKYYYQPGPPSSRTIANYPIVTDFAAWRYPKKIPDHWTRPRSVKEKLELRAKHAFSQPEDFPYVVSIEDEGCVVTKQFSASECVRLVPLDHEDWFVCNGMNPYIWGYDNRTSDPSNGLTLRMDLADCLEWHGFVFFPAGNGKFMTYVCRPLIDYVQLLHRRLVTIPPRVSDEFLYARFGHTIISLLRMGPHLNTFPIPEGVK